MVLAASLKGGLAKHCLVKGRINLRKCLNAHIHKFATYMFKTRRGGVKGQTVLLAKDGFPYLDCVHLSLNLSKAYIKKKLFFDSVI